MSGVAGGRIDGFCDVSGPLGNFREVSVTASWVLGSVGTISDAVGCSGSVGGISETGGNASDAVGKIPGMVFCVTGAFTEIAAPGGWGLNTVVLRVVGKLSMTVLWDVVGAIGDIAEKIACVLEVVSWKLEVFGVVSETIGRVAGTLVTSVLVGWLEDAVDEVVITVDWVALWELPETVSWVTSAVGKTPETVGSEVESLGEILEKVDWISRFVETFEMAGWEVEIDAEISVTVGWVEEVVVEISVMLGWFPRYVETSETVSWKLEAVHAASEMVGWEVETVGGISVTVGWVAEVVVGISVMFGWFTRFVETLETVVWE